MLQANWVPNSWARCRVLNEQLACQRGLLFQAQAMNFLVQAELVRTRQVNFIYSNPSAFSCLMAEAGVRPILSQINLRSVQGATRRLACNCMWLFHLCCRAPH